MEWLRENWFWVVVIILFVGMHMRGHGHGGHGGHGGHSKSKADGPQNAGGEEVDSDAPRGGHHD